MKIGFLNNQIDGRGTGHAVYNYAHYNEEILGNESIIFVLPNGNNNPDAVSKYLKRFKKIYPYIKDEVGPSDIDSLYHIKSGRIDNVWTQEGVNYLVHAVFDRQPHGDRYAVVSEWMGLRDRLPFVPHIVNPPLVTTDLRNYWRIPDDAVVFGRIGGSDSFDISWVWESIQDVLQERPNYYFIMVNTPVPFKHERLLAIPPSINEYLKAQFVASCDAMIHARMRGETFGISVGEFSIRGKPVFTYKNSYEKAHIFELRGTAITYENREDLTQKILNFEPGFAHAFYTRYTPERVMEKFKEVFLDDDMEVGRASWQTF